MFVAQMGIRTIETLPVRRPVGHLVELSVFRRNQALGRVVCRFPRLLTLKHGGWAQSGAESSFG